MLSLFLSLFSLFIFLAFFFSVSFVYPFSQKKAGTGHRRTQIT